MRKLFAAVALACVATMSACNIADVVDPTTYEPDFSLVGSFAPDAKTAIFNPLYPTLYSLAGEKRDVEKELVEAVGCAVLSLRTVYRSEGIYCLFSREKTQAFEVGVLSYAGQYTKLFGRDDGKNARFAAIASDIIAISFYAEDKEITAFYERVNYSEVATLNLSKNASCRLLTRFGGDFLYSYSKTDEDAKYDVYGVFSASADENVCISEEIAEGSHVSYSADDDGLYFIARETGGAHILNYGDGTPSFSKLTTGALFDAAAKYNSAECFGKYLIFGNAFDSSARMVFVSGQAVSESAADAVCNDYKKMGRSRFSVSFTDGDKTFRFYDARTDTNALYPVFSSAGAPECLKTAVCAASEDDSVNSPTAFDLGGKLCFSFYYKDKNDNRIFTVYAFDFDNNAIKYLGCYGAPHSLISSFEIYSVRAVSVD